MRLLDRLIAEGFSTGDPVINIDHTMDNLRKAQMVVIDNVAGYYFDELVRKYVDGKNVIASDFPNVMLPFDLVFMDVRLRQTNSPVSGIFEEAGVLLEMHKASEFRKFTNLKNDLTGPASVFFQDDAVWALVALIFIKDRKIPQALHVGNYVVAVNREGQIISRDGMNIAAVFDFQQNEFSAIGAPSVKDMLTVYASTCICPAYLALSFMHCRNVTVSEERPPVPLSQKHQRRHGNPLLRYRVLQIDHMKQVLEIEGKASTEGLKHALHICRGHFKRYGIDGRDLLFGRHKAMVWRPMEVRGTTEKGIVDKDYDVK